MIDPDEVRLVNCARCDEELLGLSMRGCSLPWTCDGMQFMAGRLNQRPFCKPCLEAMWAEDWTCHSSHHFIRRRVIREDESPWQEYAVRVLEDANAEV